jgi:hypothetical protein
MSEICTLKDRVKRGILIFCQSNENQIFVLILFLLQQKIQQTSYLNSIDQSLFLLFLDNLVVVLVFLTLQDKHSVPIWFPRKEDCWLTNSCLLAINIDHSFANSIMMTHLNNNSILTRLFPLSLITKAKYCRQLHKIICPIAIAREWIHM